MTRTVSVSLGGRNFIIEEGAYYCLKAYFDKFKNDLLEREGSAASAGEVMEEVEMRVADLLREYLSNREVVDEALVKEVIRQVGTPDGQPFTYTSDKDTAGPGSQCAPNPKPAHKLFRDTDNATLGGVCSGLAAYFDVDVVVMRVLFEAEYRRPVDIPHLLDSRAESRHRDGQMRDERHRAHRRKHSQIHTQVIWNWTT